MPEHSMPASAPPFGTLPSRRFLSLQCPDRFFLAVCGSTPRRMSYAPPRPNGRTRAQAEATDNLSPAERHIMEMAKREHRDTTAAAKRAAQVSGGGVGLNLHVAELQGHAAVLGQQEDPPSLHVSLACCLVLSQVASSWFLTV